MNGIWNDQNGMFPDWARYIILASCTFITIIVILATAINISVYLSSKKRESSINQKELFEKLSRQTGYNDIKLYYGQRKRFNNHFNYRSAYQELHLPKWYEDTNSQKGTMLMLYNFTNILDIRQQATNFWSRSIYCHILAAFGVLLNWGAFIAATVVSVGYTDIYNLAYIYSSLCGLGLLLMALGWLWWSKIFKKMIKKIEELAEPNLEPAEYKYIIKQFKNQAVVPFTINTSIRTHRKVVNKEATKYDGYTEAQTAAQ
ncbi:hypothetical protein [Spiroplasma culicicola]|uniref:Transmembrane protein n=1 Tax=Spiroplasma culicicola AES-1 TaxID=1276246 RepID=W6A8A0_9MOLU|nr:hypothetical protein [Spiroplasma culicicola]AHI53207.1 hypothetical protein SCULI_v1c08670 [Spiroplasma culicicola AES-1]